MHKSKFDASFAQVFGGKTKEMLAREHKPRKLPPDALTYPDCTAPKCVCQTVCRKGIIEHKDIGV
jgi:hypothetical protein